MARDDELHEITTDEDGSDGDDGGGEDHAPMSRRRPPPGQLPCDAPMGALRRSVAPALVSVFDALFMGAPIVDEETLRRAVEVAAPYARAFGRVLPASTIVPALSLRGAPASLRIALAVALAAPLAHAFPWDAARDAAIPLVLVGDVLAGIPLAVAVATPLWVASILGGVADATRGGPEVNQAPLPAADGARGALSTLTALVASSVWLASGGLVRALLLLTSVAPAARGVAAWALAARALTDGIRLGFALSVGVLAASLVLELSLAAIARVGAPISPQPLAVVARPVVSIAALAVSIEGAIAVLAR